jgi:hypothetical protein
MDVVLVATLRAFAFLWAAGRGGVEEHDGEFFHRR